ncbi:MAG: DUF342 domain-containing protein [Nitrospinota bacterium]|nr:MAG: DUF342 domain-containing protein [Nitrospinota bacterium]
MREVEQETMQERAYTITLSPDEMQAWMTFATDQPLSLDQMLADLEAAGVRVGIDRFFLQDLAEARQPGQRYLVAQGIPPEAGVEYFFPLEQERKPRRLPDGRVDFYNLETIANVIQEQILVAKIPPEQRKPGQTVTGKPIPPDRGEAVLPAAGANVRVSEDGNALIALVNGHPVLSDHVLSVYPTYTLEGDVDFSVGNLTFVGSLVIRGDVKSGFSIKCAQDVTIYGVVDEAEIEAGGSITLHGNVFGKQKGRIKSGGRVKGVFVDSIRIEAQGDICLSQGVRYSHLQTQGKVLVGGRSGHIIGGTVQALEQIVAHDLGSENEVPTRIAISSPFFDATTSRETLAHIAAVLKADQALLDRYGERELSPPVLHQAQEELKSCQAALHSLESYFARRSHLLPRTPLQVGTIVATGTVYPGVTICIGDLSLEISHPLHGVMFYRADGMIKIQKLETTVEESLENWGIGAGIAMEED